MENKDLLKDIFCTNEQRITPHKGEVDGNGEFVFTCQNEGCGRFVKFPADTTPEQFKELLVKHEEDNTGQMSVAEQNKKLAALLEAAGEEAPTDTSTETETSSVESENTPEETAEQPTE